MNFEYNVGMADVVAFNVHLAATTPGFVNARRAAFLNALSVFVCIFVTMWLVVGNPVAAASVALLVALVVGLAWPSVLQSQISRVIPEVVERIHGGEAVDGPFGRHTLEFTAEEVIERTTVNETRQKWSGIRRVDVTAGYVFLFMTATSAFQIPRSAVSDFPELLRLLAEHIDPAAVHRFDEKGRRTSA